MGVARVLYRMDSALCSLGAPPLLSYSRLRISNALSCFSVPTHLTYIPKERRLERLSLPSTRTQTGPV